MTEVDTTLTEAASALTEAAFAREDAHEAEARRRADVFLHAMRIPKGQQETTRLGEDRRRRTEKEPVAPRS